MRRLVGPNASDVREIDAPVVIGREDTDIVLSDAEVSRRHAELRPYGNGLVVRDLGSSNGTFVDGRRIEGEVTVKGGATLKVGRTELKLEISEPHAADDRPLPSPGMTRVRPVISRPDLTVVREVDAQPDVTVARLAPLHCEVTTTPPAGGAHRAGRPPSAERPPSIGQLLPFIFGGLLLVVALVLVIVLVIVGK